MRPGTLLRLALRGRRADALRVTLIALSAVLATIVMLAAATVAAVPTAMSGVATVATEPIIVAGVPTLPVMGVTSISSPQYSSGLLADPWQRAVVVVLLQLLTVPVLVLAGQCVRLGGPARRRRLAALRLAGASPRQVVALVSTEAGLAGAAGAAVGLGCYLVGRRLAHRPSEVDGRLPLPTDVLPSSTLIVVVCLAVPLLAAAATMLQLRHVILTPLGLVRRVRTGRPRPWPVVLIALGVGPNIGFTTAPNPTLMLATAVLASLGVVLAAGWISLTSGRLLHRFGRGPAQLLASRQLMADPWSASRAYGAALAVVVFAAGVAGYRIGGRAEFAAAAEQAARDPDQLMPIQQVFPVGFFEVTELMYLVVGLGAVVAAAGLLVALAESVVSRSGATATMAATGVSRRTMASALAWQSFAPLVPGIVLAMGVGLTLARGESSRAFTAYRLECLGCRSDLAEYTVPLPLAELAVIGGAALVLGVVVVGGGLLTLRSSTSLDELRAT